MGRQTILSFGVLILIGGLGLLNFKLADAPVDISPIPVIDSLGTSETNAKDSSPESLVLRSLGEFSETTVRPLFSPTRRPVVAQVVPPEAETAAAESPAPEASASVPSRLTLIGLMRVGDRDRALIRLEDAARGSWIEVGQEISGWRVSEIDDKGVVIKDASSSQVLVLHSSIPQSER